MCSMNAPWRAECQLWIPQGHASLPRTPIVRCSGKGELGWIVMVLSGIAVDTVCEEVGGDEVESGPVSMAFHRPG
jgi:hypothetical protein